MEYTPRMLDAALTARSAAAAGMVLLKNVQNALPLTAEDGEALPGSPCSAPARSSRPAVRQQWTRGARSLCWTDFARATPSSRTVCSATSTARGRWSTRAGGEYPLGSLSMEELAGCNRAAIVVIAARPEQTDCTLTDSETQMLRSVTTAFDRTILVLATPGLRRTERRRDGLPGHCLDGHCPDRRQVLP